MQQKLHLPDQFSRKKEGYKVNSYTPVSILNCFSYISVKLNPSHTHRKKRYNLFCHRVCISWKTLWMILYQVLPYGTCQKRMCFTQLFDWEIVYKVLTWKQTSFFTPAWNWITLLMIFLTYDHIPKLLVHG